jgi:hypothetical protein
MFKINADCAENISVKILVWLLAEKMKTICCQQAGTLIIILHTLSIT